jgi:hypothetical protein
MTKTEAHTLLESARAGRKVSEQRITEALIATGDLNDDGRPIRITRAVGTWERPALATQFAAATAFDWLAA